MEYGEVRGHRASVDPGDACEYCDQCLLCEFLGDADFPSGRSAVLLFDVCWFFLGPLIVPNMYLLSSLVIGLFGLVGMLGVALGPVVGRLVDKLVPWHASLISVVLLGSIQVVQVAAGGINISAVIIVAFALDVFRQMLQVSLTTSVFRYVVTFRLCIILLTPSFASSLAPEARSRLNAVLVLTVWPTRTRLHRNAQLTT